MDDATPEQEARLEELAGILTTEERMWQENGIHPSMLKTDPYFMNMQIFAIWEKLREVTGMSVVETEIHFKETFIEKMRADRAFLIKAKKEHERQERANLMLPQRPGILGADGQPLNGTGPVL